MEDKKEVRSMELRFIKTLYRQGNTTLSLLLPAVLKQLGWKEKDKVLVTVTEENGEVIVKIKKLKGEQE